MSCLPSVANSQLTTVTAALGAGGAARIRHVSPPDASDDPDGAAAASLAADIATWLGQGSPLPPADPAVAAYWVSVPGVGKSALAQGLEVTDAESGQKLDLTVKVRNVTP